MCNENHYIKEFCRVLCELSSPKENNRTDQKVKKNGIL